MKFWSWRVSWVLQVSFMLAGLCQARRDPPPGDPRVPASQLRALASGLAHLMQAVEENGAQLERQAERATVELDRTAGSLERLRKQDFQTGRTHRQVRKDLQILSARGDRLWRTVRELHYGVEDLEKEQGGLQDRLNRIHQAVKILIGFKGNPTSAP